MKILCFALLSFASFCAADLASQQQVVNDIADKIKEGGKYPDCVAPTLTDNVYRTYYGSNCGTFTVYYYKTYIGSLFAVSL